MEILPAVMIFVVVLMAGLAYFRVMRAAVLRQEIVRNAMFATIHNSGTLTTPANLTEVASGKVNGAGVDYGVSGRVVAAGRMAFVDNQTNCFRVVPKDAIVSIATPLMSALLGTGGQPDVKISTYAVIHRVYNRNAAKKCTSANPIP